MRGRIEPITMCLQHAPCGRGAAAIAPACELHKDQSQTRCPRAHSNYPPPVAAKQASQGKSLATSSCAIVLCMRERFFETNGYAKPRVMAGNKRSHRIVATPKRRSKVLWTYVLPNKNIIFVLLQKLFIAAWPGSGHMHIGAWGD
jgi:hypothetical protein